MYIYVDLATLNAFTYFCYRINKLILTFYLLYLLILMLLLLLRSDMKKMPLRRSTWKLLIELRDRIGDGGMDHGSVVDHMGMDISIRTMYGYLSQVDLTFDYKTRLWRRKVPNPGPYERMLQRLEAVYLERGMPFNRDTVLSREQLFDRFYGHIGTTEGMRKGDG